MSIKPIFMSIYVSYYLIKVSIIIDKGKEYTTNNQCSNINIIPYEIVKYLMRLPCFLPASVSFHSSGQACALE